LSKEPYKVPANRQIKTLVYIADSKPVIILIRGDDQLNETKFMARTGAVAARPATPEECFAALGAKPGSLGAVVHALEQIQTEDIRINILHTGTGDITDNDINLASASDAVVVGFNVKVTTTARRTAEKDEVEVRLYDIIYKLSEDMEAALKGMLEPEVIEVTEGRVEVRQIFRVGKGTVIAGSYVTDGRIVRGGARVWRGGKIVADDKIDSLRRFRDDVREVAQNFECGIGLAGYHELEVGDIIECFTQQTVSRVAGG